MTTNIDTLARQHNAYIKSDGRGFRRQARILQSIWREEQGYPLGLHRGDPLGNLVPLPWAKESGANFLTKTIHEVVLDTLNPKNRQKGQVIQQKRLFGNLLSSQPLCFNLFGELQQDLDLASAVVQDLTNGRADRVTKIKFEWSPGKGLPKYTNNRSAFDVYVKYRTPSGGKGFIGIEVKYHENLYGSISENSRYDEVAAQMACFHQDCRPLFGKSPLHQIWRDHLLAGIHRIADHFEDGFFVFLYPQDNSYCSKAAAKYRSCLLNENTFAAWTIEDVVSNLRQHTPAAWPEQFHDRYLNFDKLLSA